ncbi:RusA family crossover junction endodeoxyribonuclease [Sporanaerobacter sp. PP17-6a]|uniref:RusA family crossover junction endodeoxyribonuclease n=1 Tax=Sporanaerobacter sp. PP17-6a TaxID=1891289 RepID=UPI0008A0922F|nr:RusA family crossover junction endodeoxyribonuclease [Sporanaerobacter sp. PP17-6a]SCL85018.1 Holliday junction resolvase [Sporanaerobacter sp. PP17-6a]
MQEATIVIPGELPDLNTIIDASKAHYICYRDMKKKYTEMVAWLAKGKGRFKKIDLNITWICRSKKKDKDNIAAGIKFILDGLVMAGVIENDGWKQVNSFRHDFKVDKNNPRVEIEIKEAE